LDQKVKELKKLERDFELKKEECSNLKKIEVELKTKLINRQRDV